MPESDSSSVIPAQLSFLAIYNPLLGTTDETIKEQIVFYTARSHLRRKDSTATDGDKEPGDDWNERLRQVGLAQGMVTFAKNFSGGKAVEHVETEKSQIVMHELEKDWWILASVDLTRLPGDPSNGTSSQRDKPESHHYSSREMAPPQLLLQQLRRAHSTFLLHHAASLDTLYENVGRSTFCLFLENFWLRFAWNWEVLLSGNPAVDIYNGIKLSAGGELGIGVGEEEWGSGEREVLEDFVSRTDGLVDLVVSRFGAPYDSSEGLNGSNPEADNKQWLGSDTCPMPADGVVFSGVGALKRRSLASVSHWMEWIYRYGTSAYGVGDDPNSPRRRKRRKRQRGTVSGMTNIQSASDGAQEAGTDRPFSPGIPPPLVGATLPPQPPKDTHGTQTQTNDENSQVLSDKASEWMATGTETFVKYLTLGYGSSWSLSGTTTRANTPQPQVETAGRESGSSEIETSKGLKASSSPKDRPPNHNHGRFIIGLQDGTANADVVLEETEPSEPVETTAERIIRRTIHVQTTDPQKAETDSTELQAVVYIHQPFIFTFLFDASTLSLAEPSLYHSIHHQLGPLQKSLNTSTSPATAESRISSTPEANAKFQQGNIPLYDLVYDPHNLSIRSSIPNIPDLISTLPNQRTTGVSSLSRVETINIHHRLLTTYMETRSRPLELERTCKTSRGWWIVWVRVSNPHIQQDTSASDMDASNDADKQQEAFIIRRASDHAGASLSHARNSSSIGGSSGARFFRDLGGASSPGLPQSSQMDFAPGKLVEGLGLDARRYIENLLSLNR
ncbi:hypothetical protein BDV18DRAFT_135180 [Aspergillus unguis]